MRSGKAPRRAAAGFAYLLLLVLIVVLGIAAAGTVQLGRSMTRRHAEEALLVAGDDFRRALLSYRAAGGSGPAELAELLRDPRQPGVRRHLRRVPPDPLSGSLEWGLVRDAAGRIVAVHSLAPGRPIQRQGFGPTQAGFTEADSYAQWQFGLASARAASGATPGAPVTLR